jgi:nitrate reductase (NAD(P)H)
MGRALKSDWFYRSTYIYNETNINSVIISPAHNTKIVVDKLDKMYSVNGYAYSGGGRAVTGVDVSLDGGATWEQATVSRKGQPTEYDMHWSWVIWTLKVKASDLILAKEIRSRAWDSSNNRQPSEPSWNLMGCGKSAVQ